LLFGVKFTELRAALIADYYDNSDSIAKTAKRYKVSVGTVVEENKKLPVLSV
jgi:transposase